MDGLGGLFLILEYASEQMQSVDHVRISCQTSAKNIYKITLFFANSSVGITFYSSIIFIFTRISC